MKGKTTLTIAALLIGFVLSFPSPVSPERIARMTIPASPAAFAEVNGIEMYYRIVGEGSPILLIPGGLSDQHVWDAQLPILARDHTVIVADSRGQGRSTRTDDPITYGLMADDYVALLDFLHIDKVDLVGWSDGGIIGLDIAMRYPERLTSLFAQAANVTPDGNTGYAEARAEGKPIPELRHYESIDKEIHALWANEPNFTDEDLSGISVRTAIVIGDRDTAITREHTEFIASQIPGAELIILPDAGHGVPVENPRLYAHTVLRFIDGKNAEETKTASRKN
ncbi:MULTISPECIES: alpha/beta fold hydrolase [Brucella/Ochrobactrum group]|uniref:Alpha/beta hydrolase fold n=3 Tax=Brucella TaxID=234 RepID=A6WWV1_BRUA4|nr:MULTISPECIES: alpha/beta fold hydrolase [Brucella/Ochrobactrum group]QOD63545.1 alpha/beta fold hydrolase [Ochrobactrum sp. MT180101]RNL45378.1 alpha/beta fold hydrolase [Ochrobactrum sp. MH181795]ABS13455.1 alpha/beta hydrolase fold [Brucella anthropi ATCC 49188]AIK44590.1 alpha/beta hydrolase fold family protein [Brucella anthropi]KAB2705640.1 alpha/beta fold hydrolase [Brucella lupini]